jgi:hypothetical protein
MAYERYTLREKWEGITGTSQTKWLSARYTPYFKSEEEAEEYYERNFDFINERNKGRDVAVFKIIHDEIMVKEL